MGVEWVVAGTRRAHLRGLALRVVFLGCLGVLGASATLAYWTGGVTAALPLAVLGAALLGWLVLVDYRLGVWLLPFAVLLSPDLEAGVVRLRLEDILLPVVLLGWAAHAVSTRQGWTRSPINGMVLLLLLSGLVSTTLGVLRGTIPQPPLGFFFLFKRVQYLLLFFVALQVARERDEGRWLLACLLGALATTALVGLYQHVAFGPDFIVSGVRSGERATFAAVLLFLLSLCAGMAVTLESWWQKGLLAGIGLVAAVPLLFTYSRGAYVGAVAALAFVGLRRSRALLVILALLAVFASAVLPQEVHERASTIAVVFGAPERGTQSWAARLGAWHMIAGQILSQPLLGYGMAALPLGWIDNELVKELYYGGALGLVLYVLVLGGLWRMGRAVAQAGEEPWMRAFGWGFLAGFVGAMVQSITATNLTAIRSAGIFWLTAGVVAGLYANSRPSVRREAGA